MKKRILLLSAATCLFCVLTTTACATEHAAPFEQVIHKYRRRILRINMDRIQTGNQEALWLDKFLTDFGSSDFVPTREDWQRLVGETILLTENTFSSYRKSGFICQDFGVEILVQALSVNDSEIRKLAIRTLAFNAYQEDLDRYGDEIMKALGDSISGPEQWHLYGRLRLSDTDRERVFKSAAAPSEVRARVGDGNIKEKLMRQFEEAADYFEKSRLAGQLGYIGDEQCARVLIRGLSSQVFLHSAVNEVSIRGDILLALGQIFQHEPLFTNDAIFLRGAGDQMFDKYRGISEYLKDVESWCVQHYQIKTVWGSGRIWFRREFNIPLHK